MANSLDLKVVLKHLSNGTLGENLCIICLEPLNDKYENIFTTICKEDNEFCIADVLQIMCQVTFAETDETIYNACIDCFKIASSAYNFYLKAKRSHEILNFYTDELLNNIDQIILPEETMSNTLCISLPIIETETPKYDFSLYSVINKPNNNGNIESDTELKLTTANTKNEDDDFVIIIQQNNENAYYMIGLDGNLVSVDENKVLNYKKTLTTSVDEGLKDVEGNSKKRRKRGPMSLKLCTHCPVRYRFLSKLKDHMKMEHNVDLYVCKVCKAITENEQEYHSHLKTHTNIHQCAHCNMVFKRRDTIINHLRWHEKMKNLSQTDTAHICEVCGVVLEDEESMRQHYDDKHYKKFTCYYCGRMYKGEYSFELHIQKHEAQISNAKPSKAPEPDIQSKNKKIPPSKRKETAKKKMCKCPTCQRYFVDERSLMWHQRLHSNERPYACDVCGRGFISLNRRNQHTLCAHTAPTRRCPLCPALFHLRSMVNTHIKKVHLKEHKRRNRISKHQNVFWRTEPVPIQELSVDIQNEILELQAAKKQGGEWAYIDNGVAVEMEEV